MGAVISQVQVGEGTQALIQEELQKPLDGSDLNNHEEALEEVRRLRGLLSSINFNKEEGQDLEVGETVKLEDIASGEWSEKVLDLENDADKVAQIDSAFDTVLSEKKAGPSAYGGALAQFLGAFQEIGFFSAPKMWRSNLFQRLCQASLVELENADAMYSLLFLAGMLLQHEKNLLENVKIDFLLSVLGSFEGKLLSEADGNKVLPKTEMFAGFDGLAYFLFHVCLAIASMLDEDGDSENGDDNEEEENNDDCVYTGSPTTARRTWRPFNERLESGEKSVQVQMGSEVMPKAIQLLVTGCKEACQDNKDYFTYQVARLGTCGSISFDFVSMLTKELQTQGLDELVGSWS